MAAAHRFHSVWPSHEPNAGYLCYSPPCVILRYAGFSAFRMQLIMPFKKIPLCQQRPVPPPCVTLRLALFPATLGAPLHGVLRFLCIIGHFWVILGHFCYFCAFWAFLAIFVIFSHFW